MSTKTSILILVVFLSLTALCLLQATPTYSEIVASGAETQNIESLGHIGGTQVAVNISLMGSFAHIADGSSGLAENGLNTLGASVRPGIYNTPGWAEEISTDDWYMVDESGKLLNLRYSGNDPSQITVPIYTPTPTITTASMPNTTWVSPVFLLQWGVPGSGPGQFIKPVGIAIDDTGHVYVADHDNKRVQKFTESGEYISEWYVERPADVVVDSVGNIYVADYVGTVKKFDSQGNYLMEIDYFEKSPRGIAVDMSNNIYVVDERKVRKFDQNGTFILEWDSLNGYETDVAVDPQGYVYIISYTADNVKKYTNDGIHVATWGNTGSDPGQFNGPLSLDTDRYGNVYIADTYNHRIQVLDSTGQYLGQWGSSGTGEGQFSDAWGIFVDDMSNVYVSDVQLSRVQKFISPDQTPTPTPSQSPTPCPTDTIPINGGGCGTLTPTPTSTPDVPPSGSLLFQDDFDQGNHEKWEEIAGAWYVQNGNLGSVDPCGDSSSQIMAGEDTWEDYRFAFDIRRVQGWDGGNVLFRYSNSGYYLMEFHPNTHYGGRVTAYRVNSITQQATMLANNAWPIAVEQWYRFEVTVHDSRIQLLQTSPTRSVVLDIVDTEPLDYGKIGFVNRGGAICPTEVQYDNVDVYSLNQSNPTDTPTPCPTDTAPSPGGGCGTLTSTPTNTPTYTPTATPTATPSPVPGQDAFEPDNTCGQSAGIVVDGTEYAHSFHTGTDQDWVQFDIVADDTYLIDVQIPPGSAADVAAELHYACDELPVDNQDHPFAPGIHMEFKATESTTAYLNLSNHNPDTYGPDVAYHLSVRRLASEANPGAVIIVAGRLRTNDPLQENINNIANAIYQAFVDHDYPDDHILYLNPDLSQPGVDARSSASTLRSGILSWAVDKVGIDRALTLYMVDHGRQNLLYLDNPLGEVVTPQQIGGWLDQLEAAVPGVPINVIIEACKSGSFIHQPISLSGPGRVVVTSADSETDAWASDTGALFSDHFIPGLNNNQSVWSSFQQSIWAVQVAKPRQKPWLDADGDGIPNEADDEAIAAQRGFAFPGTFAATLWPPYVDQIELPATVDGGSGLLRAHVLDDLNVRHVWAAIYPPDYVPPAESDALILEDIPTVKLQLQGNNWYQGVYTGFQKPGVYRIVIYAEDYEDLPARPVAGTISVGVDGHSVYLPSLLR